MATYIEAHRESTPSHFTPASPISSPMNLAVLFMSRNGYLGDPLAHIHGLLGGVVRHDASLAQ